MVMGYSGFGFGSMFGALGAHGLRYDRQERNDVMVWGRGKQDGVGILTADAAMSAAGESSALGSHATADRLQSVGTPDDLSTPIRLSCHSLQASGTATAYLRCHRCFSCDGGS
jgi:hypothetical protein